MTTLAPASAYACETARPMPEPPPVMMAVLPLSENRSLIEYEMSGLGFCLESGPAGEETMR
jgi:hypothetical protein